MFIDLVRNYICIVPLNDIRNDQQFFPGKYLAAGIGRIAQNQGFRSVFESALQQIGIKVICRRNQRDIDRLCSPPDLPD